MADVWPVQLTGADRRAVAKLAARRERLGLPPEFTAAIRAAVQLALSADDDTLARGTIEK